MGFLKGKRVLIIGGTGTIGKSLLTTILLDQPEVVRILSRDEHKQFELSQMLSEYTNIRYLIGDVRDANRVQRAMQDIDYVFHVAAMKHVPACEYNPFEAVQTNIIGTQNVIQAALNTGVQKVVFTSTDKAIAPTNTYGASKLMAEKLITSSQNQVGSGKTLFVAVRFGNVMGSRGSVIPLFQSQIEQKRQIKVTDLSMSRFMMSLREATDLTLLAMQKAQGGETFVLKMPVIRLKDLAMAVIELASKQMKIDVSKIGLEEIGLRPGEKMYEELMTEEEARISLELPNMFIIPNIFGKNKLSYEGAVQTQIQSYNSHSIPAISQSEISRLLEHNDLLNLHTIT